MKMYEIGPFRLERERRTLTVSGKPVALGPRVVETLLALAEQAGQPVTKEALLDRVWPDGFVEESNLTQNVYVLRKTFREHGWPDAIETVPRVGYRLTVPVLMHENERVRVPARASWPKLAAAALALATAVALMLARGQTNVQRSAVSSLSPDAQRLYTIGRYYWNLRTADGVQRSMEYFGRVVNADPQNSLGYAALADANVTMGDYCYGSHRPSVYFARARAYALDALALDQNSPQAHAALGFAALHGSNPTFGIAELQRAISIDPSYAPAHEWYGIWLARHGAPAQAVPELRLASNLEPLSVSTIEWLGFAAMKMQRPNEAATYAREALELVPASAKQTVPPNHPTWAAIENAPLVARLPG